MEGKVKPFSVLRMHRYFGCIGCLGCLGEAREGSDGVGLAIGIGFELWVHYFPAMDRFDSDADSDPGADQIMRCLLSTPY